jgi:molybdopterin biosynthesis enzyme MoaB
MHNRGAFNDHLTIIITCGGTGLAVNTVKPRAFLLNEFNKRLPMYCTRRRIVKYNNRVSPLCNNASA